MGDLYEIKPKAMRLLGKLPHDAITQKIIQVCVTELMAKAFSYSKMVNVINAWY